MKGRIRTTYDTVLEIQDHDPIYIKTDKGEVKIRLSGDNTKIAISADESLRIIPQGNNCIHIVARKFGED